MGIFRLGTISAGLTSFYSFRVLYHTFWSEVNTNKYYVQKIHELPISMGVALMVLSVGSIFSGYILKDSFVGVGTTFWGNSIYCSGNNSQGFDMEFISLKVKNLPLIFSCFGISCAITWNLFISKLTFFVSSDNKIKMNGYPKNLVNFV